jgi:hypothetical protein
MAGNWGLIDLETPQSVYTTNGYLDGTEMQLVFSDEFNTDGRTFYPGDDPYWEAVDLHYWQVNSMTLNKVYYEIFMVHPDRLTIWSGTTRHPLPQKMVPWRSPCQEMKNII